jgi:hypothetical protein
MAISSDSWRNRSEASLLGSSAGPPAGLTTTPWSSRVHRTLVESARHGRGKWRLQPTVARP